MKERNAFIFEVKQPKYSGTLFLGGLITKIFLNVRTIYPATQCQIPEGFNLYSAFPVYRPSLLKANTVRFAL